MPSNTPRQTFCFYHLPTRGRAGIKLGDTWYVSNVSIIFDCSILYYLLFWTILGFIFHFYIIFGTNLLTGGPAQNCCFLPISMFRRNGISNGVQTEWNLQKRDLLTERDPGDLDPTPRSARGGHEGGGRPPGHAPQPREQPVSPLTCTPSSLGCFPSKNNFSGWFRSVLTSSDIPFPRNTEIGIKQQVWAGPPVNRLVPKIL